MSDAAQLIATITGLIERAGGEQLLRIDEVEQRTGLTRAMIYRQVREGAFPEPRRLGERSSAWLASEINAWMRGLPTISERPVQAPRSPGRPPGPRRAKAGSMPGGNGR